MELAGAQINANEGEQWGEGRRGGLCFQTKALPERRMPSVPVPETSSPGGPLGAEEPICPEPICPAVPSPLPALGSAPPSTQEGVGEDGTDFSEEGNKSPHSSLWKEMPSLWGRRGRGYSVEGGRAPRLARPSHRFRAVRHPCPQPPGTQASSPGA